jgi:hypothetical protein
VEAAWVSVEAVGVAAVVLEDEAAVEWAVMVAVEQDGVVVEEEHVGAGVEGSTMWWWGLSGRWWCWKIGILGEIWVWREIWVGGMVGEAQAWRVVGVESH